MSKHLVLLILSAFFLCSVSFALTERIGFAVYGSWLLIVYCLGCYLRVDKPL